MKKIIFLSFSILVCSLLSAQTEYDALRIGQTDIVGSARYMSMGGAFGALGGDASALKDNPAGLGVYRTGEISTTLNGLFQKANADWYGTKTSATSGLGMKFNNFSYVMSIPLYEERSRGLLQSNFSFSYNRVKNFDRAMRAKGTTNASFTDFLAGFTDGFTESALKYVKGGYDPYIDNPNVPWLSVLAYDGLLINPTAADPAMWESSFDGQANSTSLVIESGGISEYSFGWGGNFNNNLFLGANFNITDMNYSLKSVIDETFSRGGFTLDNRLSQTGMGVNMKLGAIYLPTNSLRLGLSFHTPSLFIISEEGFAKLDYNNPDIVIPDYPSAGSTNVPTDGSQQNFKIHTPLQAQVSAAYLFGRKGLLSVEYDFVNYTGMRFKKANNSNSNGLVDPFEPENVGVVVNGKLVGGMKQVLKNGHVIKIGGEFKPTENISLRAGYAMLTGGSNLDYTDGKALRLNTVNTNTEYFEQKGANYFSIGAGYREATWFIDLSYALKMQNDNFYPYQFNRNDLHAADVKMNTNNIALTVGFKM